MTKYIAYPTVSIVIPVYNEAADIEACLQAIAAQTDQPDEVIVVDNNSTDDTVLIARRFPFVRVMYERRQGLFFSREAGMRAARSEVIGRIDADTRIAPDWVHAVRTRFADKQVQALSGPVGYHDMPVPDFTIWVQNGIFKAVRRGDYQFLLGANMAVRASMWRRVDGSLCNKKASLEDIDLAVHVQQAGSVPLYDSAMRAYISARRFADAPANFWRYLTGHTYTLTLHGRAAWGAHLAEAILILGYVVFRPLYLVFDPVQRRVDLSRLAKAQAARPNPMDVQRSGLDV